MNLYILKKFFRPLALGIVPLKAEAKEEAICSRPRPLKLASRPRPGLEA